MKKIVPLILCLAFLFTSCLDETKNPSEEYEKLAAENLQKGEAFLKDNATKKGVITTESGLQYIIVREGTGEKPSPNSEVNCDYEGKLINGTIFDSSYERGEVATFPVNGVIPGWTEALQLMKVGSEWQLFIHPSLAYGYRGSGSLGPNETLIFKVELKSIN